MIRRALTHCWNPETKREKDANEKLLQEMNDLIEPWRKEEWELETGRQRMGLRNQPGQKPIWKWNAQNGKLTRKSKGGIDWLRYQTQVLIPKLLPFALECQKDRPK